MDTNLINNLDKAIETLKTAKLFGLLDPAETARSQTLAYLKQVKLELDGCQNYIDIKYDDGEEVRKFFETPEAAFIQASKLYCFDDIDDSYEVLQVVVEGRKVEYFGWQPGMLFEFTDAETNETVWSCAFPNWDH